LLDGHALPAIGVDARRRRRHELCTGTTGFRGTGQGGEAPVTSRAREGDPPAVNGTGAEVVHHRLRRAILDGELAAGAEMSQVQLARELGVSRTPLREALRMLQREGLIEAEANRMVRVASFSVEDLEELYALRIVNEALGIRLTVPVMTAEDDAFLKESLRRMERLAAARDFPVWEEHHRAFHRRLVRAAGARPLRLLAELSDHSERYRRLYVDQDPRAWSVGAAEHVSIVEACSARDVGAAGERLARHLSRTALTVLMHAAPEHEPACVRSALRSVLEGTSAPTLSGRLGAR
jgi:DNA-binding GntR family transcriptional regulator